MTSDDYFDDKFHSLNQELFLIMWEKENTIAVY